METGELPGLSGDSGICAAELKPFNPDPNGGSTLGGNGGNGGSGGGGNGNGTNNGNGNDGDDGSGRNSKTARNRRGAGADRGQLDNNPGGGRADGAGGSLGGMKSASDFFNKKGRKQTSVVGEVSDEKNYTGSTSSGKRPRMVGSLLAPGGDTKVSKLDRRFVAEPDAKEEKEPPQQTSAPENGSVTVKGKKITYTPKRETASTQKEEEGFSIGALLRFLLIAAIIIALGMLLIGQGAQISKSWEK